MTSTAPTKPRIALRVAVTGHRDVCTGTQQLEECVDAALGHLRATLDDCHAKHGDLFSVEAPRAWLLSPLAHGADQLVAQRALEAEYELTAVLPFLRAEYRTLLEQDGDRAEGEEAFEQLLARSSSIVELDALSSSAPDYEPLGQFLVEHADVLIAVWDGQPGRGPGGTEETLRAALERGVPVIDIRVVDGRAEMPQLLVELDGERPVHAADLSSLDGERMGLLPSENAGARHEQVDAATYFADRLPGPWFESLLAPLWKLWLRLWGPGERAGKRATESAREPSRAAGQDEAYRAADRLALRYGALYRSSFVANFLLGAVAVFAAVHGFALAESEVAPQPVLWLVGASEALALLLILAIFRRSRKRLWRQKATDYRLLAELLRSAHHLAPLSVSVGTSAPPPHLPGNDIRRSWMLWIARAHARSRGLGSATHTSESLVAARNEFAAGWVARQAEWHRSNAHRMHVVGHRMHVAVVLSFALTFVACLLHLFHVPLPNSGALGWVALPLVWMQHGSIYLTAFLPALAGALHGISVQGEFKRLSERSTAMARHLSSASEELLAIPTPLSRAQAAGSARRTALSMLQEVADWRSLLGIYSTPLA